MGGAGGGALTGLGNAGRQLLQAAVFSQRPGGSAGEGWYWLSPTPCQSGDEGLWGGAPRRGMEPSSPGNVLFPWLPQRCLLTANRPSGASWGLGQAGPVATGVPEATMQQEPLSDDACGRRESLVIQKLKLSTSILNKCFVFFF